MNQTKRFYKNYRKRVETILESFTDGFFELDCEWQVTYWNRTAEALLKTRKDLILERNLWEVFPETTELNLYTELQKAMASQTACRFEEYIKSVDMWFEISVFPNGQGLSIYFKDISERKNFAEELEKERQKYRDLFDHSPLPQWVYDTETLAFLDVNDAAIRHYGYSRDEFLNMSILEIRPVEDAKLVINIVSNIKETGAPRTTSMRHCKKNGEIIYAEAKGTSISFGGRAARLVVVVDKTKEVNAEMAKQQSMAKLQEISWIQAHEVRKPLSNILGLVELIDLHQCKQQQMILIEKLINQAKELDEVITKTVKNTDKMTG